ncbi:hypothetical protein [Reichenbachiella ulvae]|uniref:Uncharacterized protein n=1 Tax=Reichenbachiella ulvae TaxID=2980104 RepID=A0ABT3CSC7_9BACT|nr:hypothetical protein [Reichenbachiella ulvae]MCV9386370.1 hypothetical protein [Reichenbachiella ulvae]
MKPIKKPIAKIPEDLKIIGGRVRKQDLNQRRVRAFEKAERES